MQNPILLFVLTIISIPLVLAPIFIGFICRLLRNIILGPYLRRKYGDGVRFLRSSDALFALDRPNNPNNARMCLLVKGKANMSAYQNIIYTKWVKSSVIDSYKLSCRLCCEFGYFFWVPVKDFKIEEYCYLQDFVPKNEDELNTCYGDIFNRKFCADLSPWLITCINLDENYPGLDGPHHIFIANCHHAVSDGVTFWILCSTQLFDQTNDFALMGKFNPSNVTTMTKLKSVAKLLAFGPGATVCNLLNFPEKNILHGQTLSGTRLFAYSKTISLDRIKKIKNITNTTVNDVMTSCVAGGLRSYFLRKGESPKSNKYVMTVALHALNKPPQMDNKIIGVIFHDAADQSTPTERLLRTQENMNELKDTELAVVTNIVFNSLSNAIPRYVSMKISDMVRCTLVLSNLPCPNTPCYIFGQKVVRIGGFNSTLSKIGIGIAITTYNGDAQFGINADVATIKSRENLDRLLDDIVHEFEELEKSI